MSQKLTVANLLLGCFSTLLKAESRVRFSSFVVAPSISALTTNSSPSFVTMPLASNCSRACQIVPASERLTRAMGLKFMRDESQAKGIEAKRKTVDRFIGRVNGRSLPTSQSPS